MILTNSLISFCWLDFRSLAMEIKRGQLTFWHIENSTDPVTGTNSHEHCLCIERPLIKP